MTDAAYRAWRDDIAAGRGSVLIADTSHVVRELKARVRTERLINGLTRDGAEAHLIDGTRASVGDWIIPRKNDRASGRFARAGSGTAIAGEWPTSAPTDPSSYAVSTASTAR